MTTQPLFIKAGNTERMWVLLWALFRFIVRRRKR
ncbi:MAG: hypothetical protein QOE24_1673 [Frankiales bacterium]|jgi:hypothetical protein|nr:hypothetical protein [Frankiales bacterium]MDX6209282.1 hypothetical protein [Frankiales bacterium]